jgi:hypothetical protein
MTLSDWRSKRNIVAVGGLGNGLSLYRFQYFCSDQVFVGVLAQEVVKIVTEAVKTHGDGYMRVNYSRLGLKLLTWEEWARGTSPQIRKCRSRRRKTGRRAPN